MGRILVADDHDSLRRGIVRALTDAHHDVDEAANGNIAIEKLHEGAYDVVLSDLKMGGSDGMDVLRTAKSLHPTTNVILMTAFGTVNTAVEAMKIGAFDYVQKPFEIEEMELKVNKAIEHRRLKHEIEYLRHTQQDIYDFDRIVGASGALQSVLSIVKKVAKSNTTVLIRGETGTGKELIAGATHHNSLRAGRNFVKVNCAALQENLLESELFGHEKGAFTGATEKQIGKFEMADRGTIFLDEVGDMSPKTQAKVLRVLQEQELERLGSNRIIKVDVRVIAATNKNLEEEILKGTFREDLFYRLNVIPIHVPPLRERKEDIPGLIRHFADLFSRENNFKRKTFTIAAMERLKQHHWRGNIRELKNFVERIIIMSPGDQIDVRDLPDFSGARPADPLSMPSAVSPAGLTATLPAPSTPELDWMRAPTLQEFKSTSERAFLVNKLRDNSWNISKTAEVIDTPRSNLYKKLEQYQISQETDG